MQSQVKRTLFSATYFGDKFDVREPLLQPGDILVVKTSFATLAGQSFDIGDEIELIKKTEEAPFGFLNLTGNWVVKTKYNTTSTKPSSIWSSIEQSYADKWLEKK